MNYLNPFNSELALEHSSYSAFRHGHLVNLIEPQKTPSELAEFVHGQFYALTMDARFSCVAARAAFKQKTYRFAMYPEINSAAATAGLCRDLFAFVHEQPEIGSNFTTFVVSFAGPNPNDEKHFEKLLWQQLQGLDELDTTTWDAEVSSDPESGQFSFSFAGRSFFIVGLHAGSSRWIRRFAWPTLVFNTHDQFEQLRKTGKYAHFQRTIRSAERDLQGSINPSLSDFGEMSEATQYSGRAVEESWKCPFTAREKSESSHVDQLVVHDDSGETENSRQRN
jgi:FPC/CPF motif-containing protein YcgG